MKRLVAITGASRGLGLAVAEELLRTGHYRLALTARGASLSRLRELPLCRAPDVFLYPLDVTSQEERLAFVDQVAEEHGGVDVLVNNAGVMIRAVAEHVSDADHQRQMEVNYRAPMELTRLVLPGMRERRRGHIINITSVGGMMAMPTMSVYSASRFALEGASEALYYEVRPFGVHVTLVAPGFINSDGFERVAYTDRSRSALENPGSPYYGHYFHMADFIARIMRLVPSTPTSVARRIRRVIEQRRPPLRASGTFDASLFALLRRFLPRSLYHEVLYQCLPGVRRWGRPDFTPRQLPD